MGPIPMNLRIGGKSNDAIGSKADKNDVARKESVNMAYIIGKDKKPKEEDRTKS